MVFGMFLMAFGGSGVFWDWFWNVLGIPIGLQMASEKIVLGCLGCFEEVVRLSTFLEGMGSPKDF